MEHKTFGFVGVGRMGSLMSARLLAAGHRVCVFDTDERAVAALEKAGAQT
ncbi:MAG: NAD(P)-binding domain-containing protein, partial [Betaproteobacteria bacterium]